MKLKKSIIIVSTLATIMSIAAWARAETQAPANADTTAPIVASSATPPPSSDLQKGTIGAISLSSKVPFKFYGFISAEAMWSDSQLSSFGALNNTPASYNKNMSGFNRVVDEATSPNNDAFISFTPQNTRFGFVLDPYDFGGKNFSVDARLEMDFFSTGNMSAASILPRLRRAYAAIGQQRWRVLFGQEWDLFSPLNTATLNIGGNLWQQGNMGFRRPQIMGEFQQPIGETSGVRIAGSVNLPSNSMNFDDSGNTTGIPMLEGLFGYWHDMPAGKFWAYVTGMYARHNNATAGLSDVNNWGIAASVTAPVHNFFIPSLEFQYGYSMGLMLSIAQDNVRQRSISGWGQIQSLWLNWLETNIGYGYEGLKNSQVAAGWVKSNQVGFLNFKFKPIKHFIIGLEYNYLRTNYQGSGASHAHAALMNVLMSF
jgi:hypothetical protein